MFLFDSPAHTLAQVRYSRFHQPPAYWLKGYFPFGFSSKLMHMSLVVKEQLDTSKQTLEVSSQQLIEHKRTKYSAPVNKVVLC